MLEGTVTPPRRHLREIDLLLAGRPGSASIEEVQAALDLRERERVSQRRYLCRLRRSLRRALGNRCWFCGTRRRLQFAHKVPNGCHGEGRGLKNRLLDVREHPFLYFLACPPHHRAYDLARDPETANTPVHTKGLHWYARQGARNEVDNSEGGVVA